jgi:hypothetical protein
MNRIRNAIRVLLPEFRNWLGETVEQEMARRLAACESSVRELWAAHNERKGV